MINRKKLCNPITMIQLVITSRLTISIINSSSIMITANTIKDTQKIKLSKFSNLIQLAKKLWVMKDFSNFLSIINNKKNINRLNQSNNKKRMLYQSVKNQNLCQQRSK